MHDLARLDANSQLVGVTGFELASKKSQRLDNQYTCDFNKLVWSHIGTQNIGKAFPRLTKICNQWNKLPEAVKVGIEAMIDTVSFD